MTEETQKLLENLRLKKMATILDQELENAKNNSPSYSEFLLRLLQAQWHERQEKCLQYRIQQARLPEQWTLESFPFKKQPGVSRRQIQELAELEFIPRAENIVFIGPTGVGKTGLASGLLLKPCRTAIAACLSKRKTCSMRCMPRLRTAPHASSSSAWLAWTRS